MFETYFPGGVSCEVNRLGTSSEYFVLEIGPLLYQSLDFILVSVCKYCAMGGAVWGDCTYFGKDFLLLKLLKLRNCLL